MGVSVCSYKLGMQRYECSFGLRVAGDGGRAGGGDRKGVRGRRDVCGCAELMCE